MWSLIDRQPAHLRGPLWMVVSCISFSAMWGLIRVGSQHQHPFLILFFRTLFGTLILMPMMVQQGIGLLQTRRIWRHLRRTTASTIAMYCAYYAIAHAPMATVISINFAAPLIGTVGAVLLLREPIRMRRVIGLLAGFAGILIVLRPGHIDFTPGIAAAVLSSTGTAFSLIAIKQLTDTDDPRAVVIYSYVLMIPVTFIVALFFWDWPQGWHEWSILLGLGASSALGQYAMTRAFAVAPATVVLPFDFVRFVLVILIGIVIFGEPFDIWTVIGGSIVLASTIYVARREAVRAPAVKPASTPPLA